ncbi:MAG: asparaginase [bacterium]
MKELLVLVKRGSYPENVHRCHVVVVDREGNTVFSAGKENYFTCLRSAAKPLQAIPIVIENIDRHFGLTERELASFCGSLNAEPFQVEVVREILKKAGLDESYLKCGASYPSYKKAAETLKAKGEKPAPIYHNCAAKHAGMLLVCQFKGYDKENYYKESHPLQKEIEEIVADYAELKREDVKIVTDGCGLPVFFMPLKNIAIAYKNLALKMENHLSGVRRLLKSAIDYPEMVGGTERLCTDVIRFTAGKIFAKVGADGVYAAFNMNRMEALAMKVEDGSAKALQPAFIKAIEKLGWLNPREIELLEKYWKVPLKNSRGNAVGEIVVDI